MRDGWLAGLPAAAWAVPYVAARHPGAAAVRERPGLAAGANCQLFAYAVLAHLGLDPPALRSSELWADTVATRRVRAPRPADLILFNATRDAYGAHVGVWVGGAPAGRILHLCAEVGRPAVWRPADFAARPRYRTVVGVKRVIRRRRGRPADPFADPPADPGGPTGW